VTTAASLLTTHAILPTLCPKDPGMAEFYECIEAGMADQIYPTAITAIAAIRPAFRYELFAPEAYAAVTAGAGLDRNLNFVYKLQSGVPLKRKRPRPRTGPSNCPVVVADQAG
jgi:hypothetical protein